MLICLALALAVAQITPIQLEPPADPSRYDVVWDSASAGSGDSMPLGNGDIGVNVWTEGDGAMRFYISKTDSWSENGRLLKIGKVKITADPPFGEVKEQRLDLAKGQYVVECGEGEDFAMIVLWVDANHPVVHVQISSLNPREATASIDLWRTEPTRYPLAEVSDLMEDRSKPDKLREEVTVEADTVMEGLISKVGWYHFNEYSKGPKRIAKMQGLDGYLSKQPDPLLHRIFGAMIRGSNFRGDIPRVVDHRHLVCAADNVHSFDVFVRTEHPSNPEQWKRNVIGDMVRFDKAGPQSRKADHMAWWRDFWKRSWIHVSQNQSEVRLWNVPKNDYKIQIGKDQGGGNVFPGKIHNVQCDASDGLQIEATITPERLTAGRIVDRITPGGADGFLFDTHPGSDLRLIVGRRTLVAKNVLQAGVKVKVAASMNPQTGQLQILLNDEVVAQSELDKATDADVVARAYALQRWMDACAGRGRYPIKFNGSIFTMPHDGKFGDADYRRWGPGYWWQNTRLPYLSMCTSGDFEMIRPLFRMYAEELMPLHEHRSQVQLGHGGALVPECIYFWGPVFTQSYGWTPIDQREDKIQESPWHKWEWVAGLELIWMMLDYVEHTEDWDYFRQHVIPSAHAVLLFFHEHSPLNEDGYLVMHPSQALETWWDCTNPMPEVAGLRAVTSRLMSYDAQYSSVDDRAFWKQIADITPPLPVWRKDGKELLAPAERFEAKSNVENPELYAVHPFRLISFEKPQVELGIRALENRWDRGASGWRQDDLFMTYLGLADQARSNLVSRARNKHAGSRFPAFWGPNYDWIPDQDHGGVLMRALQTMLMQTDGRKIYLLPAWPGDWDAEFKLRAPYSTTLTGRVVDGKVKDLVVTPESRRADVILPN